MSERRSTRKHMEQRLREQERLVDYVWRSAQPESGLDPVQFAEVVARIGRRITWDLWTIAMQEAEALAAVQLEVVEEPVCDECRQPIPLRSGQDLAASA